MNSRCYVPWRRNGRATMIAKSLQETFEFAVNEAVKRSHEFVTLEHLLFALLHDRDAANAVRACGGGVQPRQKPPNSPLPARDRAHSRGAGDNPGAPPNPPPAPRG